MKARKTKLSTKKFPIVAGMDFTYPGTGNNALREVGYYKMQFEYTWDGALIAQKEVERKFYKNPK